MKRLIVCCVLACLTVGEWPATAEEQPALPPPSAGLSARMRWVRFGVVSGVLQATSPQHRAESTITSTTGPSETESLTLRLGGGLANLSYQLSTPAEQVRIEIVDGDQVTIQRGPRQAGAGVELEFRQSPLDGVVWVLKRGGEVRRLAGPTIWHALVADPDAAAEHLAPLLERLRPGWRLEETAREARAALLRTAAVDRNADQRQWAQWVADLASPRFAVRQAAERRLRAAGQAVIPYLQNLDRSQLDAEQWYRIRAILATGEDGRDDTVERVVGRLAGDRRMWLLLMADDDSAVRHTAWRQLQSLVERPIEFDPDGDPASRARQIERLQRQLGLQPADGAATARSPQRS
jgi:hypothetical protein